MLQALRADRLRRPARAAMGTAHYARLFREAGLDPGGMDEGQLSRLPVPEKAALHGAEVNDARPAARPPLPGHHLRIDGSADPRVPQRQGSGGGIRAVGAVVKPFHEVRRWQLRQTAPDAVRLLVVPSPTRRAAVPEDAPDDRPLPEDPATPIS